MNFRLVKCKACGELITWGQTPDKKPVAFNQPRKVWRVVGMDDKENVLVEEAEQLLTRHHCAKGGRK